MKHDDVIKLTHVMFLQKPFFNWKILFNHILTALSFVPSHHFIMSYAGARRKIRLMSA
jgi:hypothetical protein